MSDRQTHLCEAEEALGYAFNDDDLLDKSLTHASLVDERLDSNERLEFLGDVVLGMVVCEYLFDEYEDLLEGDLTKIKSSVVSRKVCAEVAAERGLDRVIQLGKGLSNRTKVPGSVMAAVYESLIGALYLDGGLEVARKFILEDMAGKIEQAARTGHQHNFKSVLQQTTQQIFDQTPQYLLLDEKGPDHAKCFEICVSVGAQRFNSEWGPSKKEAEQRAALQALIELGFVTRGKKGELMLLDEPLPPNERNCRLIEADPV